MFANDSRHDGWKSWAKTTIEVFQEWFSIVQFTFAMMQPIKET